MSRLFNKAFCDEYIISYLKGETMGSAEQLFDNFDFLKFLKDVIGNLIDGQGFGVALSDAGSSQLSDGADAAGSLGDAAGSLSDSKEAAK